MSAITLSSSRQALHFGMRPRTPKPFLMMIVVGLFLVIVGVTVTAQTVLVSSQVASSTVLATVSSDAATVRTFVNGLVEPADLAGGGSAAHIADVNVVLALLAHRGEILRIAIIDPAGEGPHVGLARRDRYRCDAHAPLRARRSAEPSRRQSRPTTMPCRGLGRHWRPPTSSSNTSRSRPSTA